MNTAIAAAAALVAQDVVSWDTAFSIDNLEAWDLCLGGGAKTQVDPLVAIAPGATLAMLKNAMSDLRYSKNKPKEGGWGYSTASKNIDN